MAYERVKGKKPTILGVEFGEKVLYKIQAGAELQKISPRWEYGIFVGVRRRSNELLVSRPDGVMAVQYDKLIPILINAIQELEARVKTLEG